MNWKVKFIIINSWQRKQHKIIVYHSTNDIISFFFIISKDKRGKKEKQHALFVLQDCISFNRRAAAKFPVATWFRGYPACHQDSLLRGQLNSYTNRAQDCIHTFQPIQGSTGFWMENFLSQWHACSSRYIVTIFLCLRYYLSCKH